MQWRQVYIKHFYNLSKFQINGKTLLTNDLKFKMTAGFTLASFV